MKHPDKLFLLSLDFAAGTVTRYVHHRGCYGVRRMQRAVMDGGQLRQAAGTMSWELERFRLTGEAK